MAEKRWKSAERRIAAKLQGKHLPRPGKRSVGGKGGLLVWEHTDRERIPQFIVNRIARAKVAAGPRKLGVCIITSPNSIMDLICLDLNDFKGWFKCSTT